MTDCAKLCPLAEYEIEELREDGFEPNLSEIVEINALAWAAQTSDNRISLSRGIPMFAGNVALWPLTLEAGDWYMRISQKLPTEYLNCLALGYAMANCYSDNGAFDKSKSDTIKAIMAFTVKMKCRHGTLKMAISDVLQQDENPDMPPPIKGKEEEDHSLKAGDISLFLAANSSATAEFWESRCSASYTLDMLSKIVSQDKADGKNPQDEDMIKATIAMGWAVEKVKQRVRDNG